MAETGELQGKVSDWVPTTNKVHLAVLGKLIEELTECAKIAARCMIQGPDGVDPSTGKPNLDALRDELADVKGMTTLTILEFNLHEATIHKRCDEKFEHKVTWIDTLR